MRHRQTGELRALKFCQLDGPSYFHLRAEAQLAARVSRNPFVLTPLAISDSPGRAGNYSVLLPLLPGATCCSYCAVSPRARSPNQTRGATPA